MTRNQVIKATAIASAARFYQGANVYEDEFLAFAEKIATFIRGENINNPEPDEQQESGRT